MGNRREAIRLLGITPNATEAEVRAAFRRKVIEHHPDTAVQGTDAAAVRELIDAYRLLTHPEPRTMPIPEARWSGKPDSDVLRIPVNHTTSSPKGHASSRTPRWCHGCLATGLRVRLVTCPACSGGSIWTTLGVRQARVSRCPRCRGRGEVRSVELCRACEGTGVDRT